jgi:hypothetical protein
LNGTQEGSDLTDTRSYGAMDYLPRIGWGSFNGWVDEVRVVQGTAAWTTTFTPPIAPYDVGIGPYDELSCSRASIGYAQTVAGTLVQFAANQLRITDKGLLVEDARTNLCDSSQDMSNVTYWSRNNVTATANAAVAPDGTTTATKIIQDAGGGNLQHEAYNALPAGTAVPYSCSVYLKAAELNFGFLKANVNHISSVITLVVNLTTGASSTNNFGGVTGFSSSVEALANGWFRLTMTFDDVVANNFIACGPLTTFTPTYSSGNPTDTSTGTNGIYAWGAQEEIGSFASSYIPTTTTSVTRAADVILAAGIYNSLLDSTAGSAFADVGASAISGASNASRIIGNNVGGNAAALCLDFSNTAVTLMDGTSLVISATLGNSLTYATGFKAASSWDGTGTAVVGGGGAVTTGAALVWDHPAIKIGSGAGGFAFWWGYIKRLAVWDSKLADATLQSYTAPTGTPVNAAIDLNFETGVYTINSPLPLLSCSRASVAYAQTVAGTLVQFAANQLRITDKGLLIEDAWTNYMYPSNMQTSWNEDAVTRTTNVTTSPYPGELACKLIGSSGAGTHRLWQASTVGAVTGSVSFFAKAADYNYVALSCYVGGAYESAIFDLTTGALTDDNITTMTVFDAVSAGNGWWRVSASIATASDIYLAVTPHPTSTSTFSGSAALPSYTGDGTSGVYVWGAQIEVGAFASSYIPTTTGSAMRALDSILFLDTAKTILVALPNSVVVDVKAPNFKPSGRIVAYSDAGSNSMLVFTGNNDQINSNAIFSNLGNSLTWITGAKVGVANASSDHAVVGGGGTVNTDTSPTTGTPNPNLGGDATATTVGQMYARRVTIWNTRLANATLQGFTNP